MNGQTLKISFWLLLMAGLGGLCVLLFVVLLMGNSNRAEMALNQGKRVGIIIAGGKVLGNPETTSSEKEEEETDALSEEKTKAEEPQAGESQEQIVAPEVADSASSNLNPALPGDFVGGQLESQQSVLDKKEQENKPEESEHDYPLPVKQEPQTRQQSVPAPAKGVNVRDLLKVAPTGKELPKAPLQAVSEKTEGGILPKISKDGLRPWQAYGKKFSAGTTEPLVTIIITGLGMVKEQTQAAQHLQEDFTLSYSPYASQPDLWASHARADGHEVMIDLPMQQADYPASDPGPMGVLSSLKPEENKQRLHKVLSRFSGYVGVVESVGAAVPPAVIQLCLTDIASRGLLMAEAPQSGEVPPASQKQQMGLVSFRPDALVDASLDAASIDAALQMLTEKAKKQGAALGIARAYPLTLERLQAWQEALAEQGVKLAPLSALAVRGNK